MSDGLQEKKEVEPKTLKVEPKKEFDECPECNGTGTLIYSPSSGSPQEAFECYHCIGTGKRGKEIVSE